MLNNEKEPKLLQARMTSIGNTSSFVGLHHLVLEFYTPGKRNWHTAMNMNYGDGIEVTAANLRNMADTLDQMLGQMREAEG